MKNSLALAIEALSWMAYAGLGERTALFKAAEQLGVDDQNELRQAHRLIMETTRFQNRLEHLVEQAARGDQIRQAPHGVRTFLKILALLRYVNRTRDKELQRAVSWARQILGWRELHPYEEQIAAIVSGTTGAYARDLNEFDRLSLETCHPAWFVERIIRIFGRKFGLQMLRRNLHPLPTYGRLNPLKISDEAEKDRIAHKLGASKVQQIPDMLRFDKISVALVQSNLLASGEMVIQDLASSIASLVARPKPGATVLDLCAAPGNKTSHLAALMKNQGAIYSIEISDQRLSHWKKEIARTGCSIASPIRADARRIPVRDEVNVVLVDPPCSNTGVFARNPTVKWKVSPARVHEFATKQYSILQAASEHIAPNGTLVYCTCSILPEENEFVLEAFLGRKPNFRVVPQTPVLGSPGLRGFDRCQRFYPHLHDCNGYFIAKLQRTV